MRQRVSVSFPTRPPSPASAQRRMSSFLRTLVARQKGGFAGRTRSVLAWPGTRTSAPVLLSRLGLVGGLFAAHIGDEVPERQVNVNEVVAPCRAQCLGELWPDIEPRRYLANLKPGRAASVQAGRRVHSRVDHPRHA